MSSLERIARAEKLIEELREEGSLDKEFELMAMSHLALAEALLEQNELWRISNGLRPQAVDEPVDIAKAYEERVANLRPGDFSKPMAAPAQGRVDDGVTLPDRDGWPYD